MTRADPTTPFGIRFLFGAEAEPVEGDAYCVFCNHDRHVGQRKAEIARNTDQVPRDISDDAAKCRADYQFVVGHEVGEHAIIPVCEGCLHGVPVEYGDSSARDLPYRWEDEVVLTTTVPRLDADTGDVHRQLPVRKLADFDQRLRDAGGNE